MSGVGTIVRVVWGQLWEWWCGDSCGSGGVGTVVGVVVWGQLWGWWCGDSCGGGGVGTVVGVVHTLLSEYNSIETKL